jgi:hypothetical protein
MPTTRVDVEDLESTRSERFLAVVLTAFLLIGAIWLYVKTDSWFGEYVDYRADGTTVDHEGSDALVAVLRLVVVLGILGASYLLIGRLRRDRSRYLPLGFSVAATGAILALVFAVDYITEYIDPLDLGPIVLSLLGGAATVGAFVGLQRYLARHIPGRRVRKGECPFCGYPAREGGPYCEGCGREVLADCSTCHAHRRVGSTHCVACGAV